MQTNNATETQINNLRRHVVNDITREIMARGVTLSWEQANDLGDETIDWMTGRLGLNKSNTDAGVVFDPPMFYTGEVDDSYARTDDAVDTITMYPRGYV